MLVRRSTVHAGPRGVAHGRHITSAGMRKSQHNPRPVSAASCHLCVTEIVRTTTRRAKRLKAINCLSDSRFETGRLPAAVIDLAMPVPRSRGPVGESDPEPRQPRSLLGSRPACQRRPWLVSPTLAAPCTLRRAARTRRGQAKHVRRTQPVVDRDCYRTTVHHPREESEQHRDIALRTGHPRRT